MADPQNALNALQQSLSQPVSPNDPGSQQAPQIVNQSGSQNPPQVFGNQPQVPSNKPGLPATIQVLKDVLFPSVKMGDLQQGPSRPTSRLDAFEGFLGNFMTSLASGFQTAPGPGANIRAASAAMTAPLQANRQQFALQQQANEQQAKIEQQQAQSELARSQATEIYIPGIGMMPAKNAQGIIQSQIRGITTTEAAKTRTAGEISAANIRAGSAEQIANIKAITETQRNEIQDAFNKGRLGELLLENKIKQLSVEDQYKYHMALIPMLQESAAARTTSAGAQQTAALSNAGNKIGTIARLAAAFGWNDVGDAANEELQKVIGGPAGQPAIPTQPKGSPPAGLPQAPKQGTAIDAKTAKMFIDAAGGDNNKARLLIRQNGWIIPNAK